MKYKKGETFYECFESKYRQPIEAHFLVKFAQAGDWVCHALDAEGEKIGYAFIAQPKEFYENFVKAD